MQKLSVLPDYVCSIDANDTASLAKIHHDLCAAEAHIRLVDQRVIPILATRTPSDPKYDDFVVRLLDHLGMFGFQVVTTHMQHGHDALAVDTNSFDEPVFYFLPSIRSFDALSLLYHEIGHLYWSRVLSRTSRLALTRLMLQLDREWQSKSDRGAIGKEPSSEEIQREFPEIWIHRGEIATDAFAGLVGGYAYTSALCSFFLFRRKIHEKSESHPPPVWRAWFSQHAAEIGGSKTPIDTCPAWAAWNTVVRLPRRHGTGTALLDEAPCARQFILSMQSVLRSDGLALCSDIEAISLDPAPSVNRTSILPAVLEVAARYRSRVSWRVYRDWERRTFPRIGLPSRRLLGFA